MPDDLGEFDQRWRKLKFEQARAKLEKDVADNRAVFEQSKFTDCHSPSGLGAIDMPPPTEFDRETYRRLRRDRFNPRFNPDYVPPPPPVETDHAICARLIEGFDAKLDAEIERQESNRNEQQALDLRPPRLIYLLALVPVGIIAALVQFFR